MKLIEKKTFEVSIMEPESAEEDAEIKRIIQEVKSEKFNPDGWVVVDNTKK